MPKFIVQEKEQNCRLDKFLSGKLLNLSRSQIQKIIKKGGVTVNKKKELSSYKVKTGDAVIVMDLKVNDVKFKKQPKPEAKLEIVFENKDYLIINKPAGLLVHSTDHIQERSVVDIILDKYPEIGKVGEDPARPGIVHRLDRDVSGLMIIARNQNFFDWIKEQFKKRKVEKIYTALVYGEISKDEDLIEFPIKRSSRGGRMAALPIGSRDPDARKAVTEFWVQKRFYHYTLLEVRIKTGRTHQIRVHLFAYGYPIVGDNIYNTKKTREQNKKINLGRVFLVARELSFYDLNNQKQKFKIDLPDNLRIFLKNIKQKI